MKTSRLLALLLTLFVPLLAFSQKEMKAKSGGDAEQQIKNYLEQSRQAAVKGDTSVAEANLADDYVRVDPQGNLLSKADLVNGLKSGDVKYTSIEVKDLKVRTYGNTAVATHSADVKGTNKGRDITGTYRVTRVFVKRNGKWQEVSFHSTRIAG